MFIICDIREREWFDGLQRRERNMNNFIFENATKTIFGEECVKEYLACLSGRYGEQVLLAYGGGSIKENGIYGQVMESLRLMERCSKAQSWQKKARRI